MIRTGRTISCLAPVLMGWRPAADAVGRNSAAPPTRGGTLHYALDSDLFYSVPPAPPIEPASQWMALRNGGVRRVRRNVGNARVGSVVQSGTTNDFRSVMSCSTVIRPAGKSLARLSMIATLLLAWITSCGRSGSHAQANGVGADTIPRRGGTLHVRMLADLDHLTTTAGYTGPGLALFRTFTRQLVSLPADTNIAVQLTPVADLATRVPTRANGDLSDDGLGWTFHLRRGTRWNTTPPRAVTAHDAVRGIKMLCNPVMPTPAPHYYLPIIAGLREFCTAFARVPPSVPTMRQWVETHDVAGVRALDDSTVVSASWARHGTS